MKEKCYGTLYDMLVAHMPFHKGQQNKLTAVLKEIIWKKKNNFQGPSSLQQLRCIQFGSKVIEGLIDT